MTDMHLPGVSDAARAAARRLLRQADITFAAQHTGGDDSDGSLTRSIVRKHAAARRLLGLAYICPACHCLRAIETCDPPSEIRWQRRSWRECTSCGKTYGFK